MNKMKSINTILSATLLAAMLFVVSSCIGDQSVAKKRGLVKDFSTTKTTVGCLEKYLIYDKPYDSCTSDCSSTTGFHIATVTELSTAKKELVSNAGNSINGVDATTILNRVNNSANICVEDVIVETRPTNDITIKSDFCSCINGKSDVINNCDSFCASKTTTTAAILYVNTVMGPNIALNTKLGNLYNWCSVQLENDTTTPQCALSASDGTNTITLPVNVVQGSNSFSVNINSLSKDKTYLLKIFEQKTGSNAQSQEFQVRRKTQVVDDGGTVGALKLTPINQYSCMTYGGKVDATGTIIRTTYARVFYYFASNETPTPIPPAGGTTQSQVVCHDEQLHPGNDSAVYPRLELIPGALAMWDKSDTRFVAKAENAGKLTINKTLETRLQSEYNITSTIDLFRLLSYPNRPTTTSSTQAIVSLGYIMVPFSDSSGKTYCPTSVQFNGNLPLFNLLGEYMDDTEGLYLGEKEAETIQDGSGYKTVYGTMFVRETTLKNYGFYIENGLKIAVSPDPTVMNTKTIYYYWPVSTTADALTQGNRKLFTVRTASTLNGNVPSGQATSEVTTDKRIGCIPKSN